jgi:2,4-dienoyl-CoA reductase-like NADH-dependent reductase (Old Yellow Enzyme family)
VHALSFEKLFETVEIKGLTLKSRLVMPGMTRAMSHNGVPGKDLANYYCRRVQGGMGLVITEGTAIDHPSACPDTRFCRIADHTLEGWRSVVRDVHQEGGIIFMQLWHAGGYREPGSGPFPQAPTISPSGLSNPGTPVGQAMSTDDIQAVIDAYVLAAKNARDVGFDGVEVHAAHGYLVDQFLWQGTNHRTDKYGGSLERRAQFAVDVVSGIRNVVGPGYPISLRMSQWKERDFQAQVCDTPEQLATLLALLKDAGVDLFHCSARRFWIPEFDGSDLTYAGWTRKLSGLPTIAVGSVGLSTDIMSSMAGKDASTTGLSGMAELMRRMNREEFDLVAVGRAVLSDPDWAQKVRSNRFSEIEGFTAERLSFLD